jgi:hypothetical protein
MMYWNRIYAAPVTMVKIEINFTGKDIRSESDRTGQRHINDESISLYEKCGDLISRS